MLPEVCKRPEVGRLTGRGNTANLESVLALKPDLILDVGSTSPTFASLAARVQEQTGIPYALLDGRFRATASTYRLLGALTRRDAEPLASYTEKTLAAIEARVNRVPEDERPRVFTPVGRVGWRPGLAARSMWRRSNFWARVTSPPSAKAALPRSRSSRCWFGIHK